MKLYGILSFQQNNMKNTKQMISKTDFYNLYNKNSPRNSQRKDGNIDARLILRDLSLPIAYLSAKRNINASQVTVLSLIVGMFAGLILAIELSPISLFVSFILFEIAQLLDCVDGQLARYYGQFSKAGLNLDTATHKLIPSIFLLSVGSNLFFQTSAIGYLISGAIGAVAFAFDDHDHEDKPRTESGRNKHFAWIKKQLDALFKESRFFALLLFVVSIGGVLFNNENLIKYSFLIGNAWVFLVNVVLKIREYYNDSNKAQVKEWKGWS